MKKDIKTIDQLLNQIQEIKKEVNEYKDKAQRMLEIKDQIIELLERQKAIYKRDLNIMLWVCFVLSICAVTMLIITL
jgi:uncharacterized protein (UPF0305 family)